MGKLLDISKLIVFINIVFLKRAKYVIVYKSLVKILFKNHKFINQNNSQTLPKDVFMFME